MRRATACASVKQLIGGHDARDEAERLGRARVDRVAGQDHFRRARQADGTRQDPGAAVARHDADLDEAGSELGRVGREADVADAGQVEAEADRVAVDGRDHRHFAIPQGADHALDAAAIVRAGRLGRAEAADAAAGLHSLEVAAGAEAGPGAGQHDAADAGVLFGPTQGVDDVLAILLRADGVAALGAVQGQGDDAVGGGVLHEALGHLASPVLQAAGRGAGTHDSRRRMKLTLCGNRRSQRALSARASTRTGRGMRTPLRDSLIGPRLQDEPAWLRYGLAIGLLACTAFARVELIPLIGRHSPLLAFVLPVVATSYLCGRGPAWLIALASPVLGTWLFHDDFSWSDPLGWLAHVTFFVLVCAALVELLHHLQVTHRKLLDSEARLLEADRRKNEFLAMLAHELRNPLASIVNIAPILGTPGVRAVDGASDERRPAAAGLAPRAAGRRPAGCRPHHQRQDRAAARRAWSCRTSSSTRSKAHGR